MRRFLILLLTLAAWATAFAGGASSPEFDGYCAYSLANGAEVKTECDVVWISGEGKLYCFMNQAARDEFVKDAPRNLRKARAFWEDPAYWDRLRKEEAS